MPQPQYASALVMLILARQEAAPHSRRPSLSYTIATPHHLEQGAEGRADAAWAAHAVPGDARATEGVVPLAHALGVGETPPGVEEGRRATHPLHGLWAGHTHTHTSQHTQASTERKTQTEREGQRGKRGSCLAIQGQRRPSGMASL